MEEYVLTRPGILSSEHSPTRLPRAIRAIPIQSLSYSHPAQSHRSSNPSLACPSFVSVRRGARARASTVECDRPWQPGPGEACHAQCFGFGFGFGFRHTLPVPTLATRDPQNIILHSHRAPGAASWMSCIVYHSHEWDTWRREPEIMMEVGSVTLAWDMTRTLWSCG